LRDNEGAESVNVVGSIRNDIYQEVADKVNGYLAAGDYTKFYSYVTNDGEKHVESTVALADSIKGKITRSLTKRNTMTQPYSVTKFGMFEQLKVELSELEDNGKKFWIGENWLMTKLLTDLNARAIDETVKGAKVGQMYLKGVTADLVKQGKWVFYTAPLTSFPVLQKVHVQDETRVSTPIGKLTIRTTSPLLKASSMISGIAPNYIHSLDAALLSTTVMKLKDDGCVNFHLIHDSYAVPINYVANLNKRVRESFIELFQTNPLQQFVEQVNPTYSIRPEEVLINTLNLDRVLDSKYIFS
jgi:DNA-directed RNA polymerase